MANVAEHSTKTEEIVPSRGMEVLRSGSTGASPIGVDDTGRSINGYIVAEIGVFETGRGEFDRESLAAIVRLMNENPEGTPVNYGHYVDTGTPDALSGFLGFAKNARLDGNKVRADLKFDSSAFVLQNGTNRGEYLLTRAKSAPASFGSSLVLKADKSYRLDARGRKQTDSDGALLPPIWRPKVIRSSDLVSRGDATPGGLLSADDDAFSRPASALDLLLAGMDQDAARAFLALYGATRFPVCIDDPTDLPEPDGLPETQTGDSMSAGVAGGSADTDMDLLRRRNANRKRKAGRE